MLFFVGIYPCTLQVQKSSITIIIQEAELKLFSAEHSKVSGHFTLHDTGMDKF